MTSKDIFEIITENITIDDLPNEDLKFVATFCGMEVALLLIKYSSGMTLHIPQNCFKELTKRYIIKNHDGTRACEMRLALTCKVTERYIRKLIKAHKRSLIK